MSEFEMSEATRARITRALERQSAYGSVPAEPQKEATPVTITDLHWTHITVIVRMVTDRLVSYASQFDQNSPIVEQSDNWKIVIDPKTAILRGDYITAFDRYGIKYQYYGAPRLAINRKDQG